MLCIVVASSKYAPTYIISVNCVTPFGVAITDKPALTIDCIIHPALEETIKYDRTLDLALVLLQK